MNACLVLCHLNSVLFKTKRTIPRFMDHRPPKDLNGTKTAVCVQFVHPLVRLWLAAQRDPHHQSHEAKSPTKGGQLASTGITVQPKTRDLSFGRQFSCEMNLSKALFVPLPPKTAQFHLKRNERTETHVSLFLSVVHILFQVSLVFPSEKQGFVRSNEGHLQGSDVCPEGETVPGRLSHP